MRRIYKTFRFKVFASFFAVILCCIVMISTVTGRISLDILRKNNYETANGLLNQVKFFSDSKFDELQELMETATTSTDYLRLMKGNYYERYSKGYYADITTVLNNMQMIRKSYSEIVDSVYYYNEGYQLELYALKEGPVVEIDHTELLQKVKETGNLQMGWLSVHEESIFQTTTPRNVISLYRYTAGTLYCINLRTDIFQQALDYSVFGENCYLMLIGNLSSMWSDPCNEVYLPGAGYEVGEQKEGGWSRIVNGYGKELLVTGIQLESNGWTVAAVMPEDYLDAEAAKIYQSVFLWAFLILIIASCLAYLISRSVTEPVRFVTQQMQKVQEDNLDVDFTLKDRESELGVMAETLNQMTRRMVHLIGQAKEQERLQRKTEIAVLQAQINPHFLYNTLTSALGLIHGHDNEKAEYILKMLIVFFRTGLGRGSDKVTLEDELKHAGSYLEIQKMRYEGCFEYEMDVEDGVEKAEVIKLSLQPIVENAIYHGAKEKPGKRLILVSAVKEGDALRVCVFDDGAGMSEECLANVRREIGKPFGDGSSSVSYGLRNVNQRLILEYGKEYGLELESVEGEYTMVSMRFPYRLEEKGEDSDRG